MCGRYAAAKDTATLVEEFQVETVVDPAPPPSWNVAPTDQVAMVVDRPVEDRVQRQLRSVRWGLVPSWAKDPKIGARMINARWEEAPGKPAFRAAFARRRCLVPADGWFEWYQPVGADASPARPRKQPYYVHPTDESGLALAGLYEFWRPTPDDEWLVTVAVLTAASTGALTALHPRMPLVVDPASYTRWLDPTDALDPEFAGWLPVDRLAVRPVGTAVNSVRNDGPELILPIPAEAWPAEAWPADAWPAEAWPEAPVDPSSHRPSGP